MEMTGINYTTGVTYFKLRHTTDDKKECFIGSTKNMRNQISVHKSACKNLNCITVSVRMEALMNGNMIT